MADSPIIYLRGYAATQKAVEETVDDPFYGFNFGSTHVRLDAAGVPAFFAFQSPLVRLMRDHGFADVYDAGRQPTLTQPPAHPPTPRSVWIYRYYDITSRTFRDQSSVRVEIEQAAKDLASFIELAKQLIQPTPEKVILVAHSMGGLIVRSLIQKIYREQHPGEPMPATKYIDKVFTYGTPHGGIHFDVPGGGLLEWARDQIGADNSDDFGPRRMYQFLTPDATMKDHEPKGFEDRVNDLDGAFPLERFFCLVGTNANDYDAARGISRNLVGPASDGLVQIRHAYVKGTPRAYVHRSHSGRYGMVNSEEGYQNLRRFLFGNMRVEIFLDHLDKLQGFPPDSGVSHQAEAMIAIRGLPVLMHDQELAHHSPILLELEKTKEGQPIPLFTVFLIPELAADKKTCRYAVKLAVHRLTEKEGFLFFADHLEQIPLWADNLVVDLVQGEAGGYSGRYAWRSEQPDPGADPAKELDLVHADDGTVQVRIPLPDGGRQVVGDQAEILMKASPWS